MRNVLKTGCPDLNIHVAEDEEAPTGWKWTTIQIEVGRPKDGPNEWGFWWTITATHELPMGKGIVLYAVPLKVGDDPEDANGLESLVGPAPITVILLNPLGPHPHATVSGVGTFFCGSNFDIETGLDDFDD